ncbi:acyl carrier protein phosphodiesterase [Hymenobacter sp. BT770]|uniref:acyl carrier protein phosphodiesterase n=1 Tax=Hymenobacter sp. BT770 TaxID=2886942 RepID=UPI001D0FDE8A|nr:acyl carrier protein phosphodiesterase [Hymenobacter sp. BT770]MCC3152573.1 acyl carrier protein phosphodiesterase [Hymenobacter sp. BT770]MDO3414450.1 acyl carrier protein phosphodiesterase [Hymenobacter sp. BT770]
MNFLAHLLLSGSPDSAAYAEVLLGNFIADSVPGKQLENYPVAVQTGIRLHRAIDTFTDQHPVVRRATQRLRAAGYGKYAGVISDMFLDHFLARNFMSFSTEGLADFAQRVYGLLTARQAQMPPRVQHFLPYMTEHNWLLGYADLASITRALSGLSRRASPGSGMETAVEELQANYAEYEADFQEFFPQLQQHVAEMLG